MADAAALRDLGTVLLWGGAFIIATLAYYIAHGVARGLREIWLIGGALAGAAAAVERYIAQPLDELRKSAEGEVTRGLSGLVDELGIIIGLGVLLGEGVLAALKFFWNHALEARVVSWIARELAKIHIPDIDVPSLTARVERNVEATLRPEIAAARDAASEARAFASSAVRTGVADAERYADSAVATLRGAEEGAIAQATTLARAAETEAAGVVSAAVDAARAVAVPIEHDLSALDAYIQSLGLAGLIAAVPALATLVHALAVDTGLENEECRSKVKGICQSDPAQWGKLLGGLALMTGVLDFRELVALTRPLVRVGADLIRQAA